MKEAGLEKRVGVSHVLPPFLACSKTFFLLSCLGEKRGGPLSCQTGCGAREAFMSLLAPAIPTPVSLSSPFPPFLCLFNWTDWPQLSHLQSWGQVEIPGNQYCSEAEQSCGGKNSKAQNWCANRGMLKENETGTHFECVHINFAAA